MSYLSDSAVALICFAPVFVLMSFIFGVLIWNSLPSRTVKKNGTDDEKPDGH